MSDTVEADVEEDPAVLQARRDLAIYDLVHKEGYRIDQVARRLGMPRPEVCQCMARAHVLREAELAKLARKATFPKVDPAARRATIIRAVKLRQQGFSYPAIAEEIGVSLEWARKVVTEHLKP